MQRNKSCLGKLRPTSVKASPLGSTETKRPRIKSGALCHQTARRQFPFEQHGVSSCLLYWYFRPQTFTGRRSHRSFGALIESVLVQPNMVALQSIQDISSFRRIASGVDFETKLYTVTEPDFNTAQLAGAMGNGTSRYEEIRWLKEDLTGSRLAI